MKNRITGLLGLLLASLFLGGCSMLVPHSANIQGVKDLRSNEAVVVGRVRIVDLGKDVTASCGCLIIHYGPALAQNIYKYNFQDNYARILSKNGLICARVPVGESLFWELFWWGEGTTPWSYRWDAPIISPEPGRAYYIGDITIETDATKHWGLDSYKDLHLKVLDNMEATGKEYREQFPYCPKDLIRLV